MILAVAPEICELGLSTAVLVASGVDNTTSSPELVAYRRAAARSLANHWKSRSISAHPAVREYHRVHELFGVLGDPPAPEKLVLYVRRNRDLTAAGPLVDCYNVVSARTLLSLGAHDLDRLDGIITLRRTTDSDSFQPLGGDEQRPLPGEFGYVDPRGRVICRMDVLQCEWSKVTKSTRSAAIFVQGNRCLSPAVLLKGCWLLAEMLATFCGGDVELVAFSDARTSSVDDVAKPRIGLDRFNELTLAAGRVVRVTPLAGFSLSAVTIRTDAEFDALAPSDALGDAAVGRIVPVATRLHPLKVAGRTFSAYLPLLRTALGWHLPALAGAVAGSRLYGGRT